MMKQFLATIVLVCALASVQGRQLQQSSFKSVGDALAANKDLSTLAAAIKASGITVPDGVTILAPANKAFADSDVVKKTGLTAAQLLLPANKAALVEILQYHVVPAGAVRSTQLKSGQQLKTALAGAAPLSVKLDDGKVKLLSATKRAGDMDDAKVVAADVVAGKSIIHVIDEVLVPAKYLKA